MANVNTTAGIQNWPAQIIGTTTETALLVPALTNPPTVTGWPSPAFAAASGVAIGFPTDVIGAVYDGHPFLVTLIGTVTTGASLTFLPKIYQVPATIIAAGTQATVSNDHVVVALAATTVATATVNFSVQAQFLWDSTSKILNGQLVSAQINGVNIAPNAGTAGTSVATTQVTAVGIGDLNFLPSFTFGTANAANAVVVKEFTLDRV